MTVCIAAITENQKIVSITDKMLTVSNPLPTTYEAIDNNKIFKLNETTVALTAGSVVDAQAIIKSALEEITVDMEVSAIAQVVNNAYINYWDTIVSSFLQMRYKITLEEFMRNQKSFDEDFAKNITAQLQNFTIDVQILVAGTEPEPRLYIVSNSGSATDMTSLGFAAIGSGEKHATLSLIESEYRKEFSVPKSVLAVFKAKKRAELDPGVGELCEITIIDPKVRELDDNKIASLVKTYKNYRKKIEDEEKKVYDEIDKGIKDE